jgi:serine/threonine protein kinase
MPTFEDAVLGQTLDGKYRLRQVRLRGAFSVTFAAEEFFCRTFVRPVLVTLSRQTGLTDVTAPHYLADALRLAQAQAEPDADHGLVPAVLALGLAPQLGGCGLVVTETAPGAPLPAGPAAGPGELAARLRLFKDLCRGLALVHRSGAAHRELRPEAVVVDARGTPRVIGVGLAIASDPRQALLAADADQLARLAPETFDGSAGPAADVYGAGLILYEWLTGGGPHLLAPWTGAGVRGLADVVRLKQTLNYPAPPSTPPWFAGLLARCLDPVPSRRFADAGQLLAAVEACEAGRPLPAAEAPPAKAWAPARRSDDPGEALLRDARRYLARGEFAQAIDRLDVYRPAEWAVVDAQAARLLRVLGQAYVRKGDWRAGRECLEQLRTVQREQALVPPPQYAVALADLLACYTALGLSELAENVRHEARHEARQAKP